MWKLEICVETFSSPPWRCPIKILKALRSGSPTPLPPKSGPSDEPMTTGDPVMDTLTARLTSLELQPQIRQCVPTGDAGPPGRSLDSSSEGLAVIADTSPPEPMETNGTPGESSGSLPAARTESGEMEETPGRGPDSPPEAEEINLTSLEPVDPVDALRESFGSLPVGCTDIQTQPKVWTLKNRSHRRKSRGGALRPKPKK